MYIYKYGTASTSPGAGISFLEIPFIDDFTCLSNKVKTVL